MLELKDQIQHFIGYADKYFSDGADARHYAEIVDKQTENGYHNSATQDALLRCQSDHLAALAVLLETGAPLAAALEGDGGGRS